MSQNGIKKHRNLHGIRIPCPICKEFRPTEPSFIVVRMGRYTTYYHDAMWDGANAYLNKKVQINRKEKMFYEIQCTGKCMIHQSFQNEEELPKVLQHVLEDLIDDLAKVPPPPGTSLPITQGKKSKKQKWVFRLMKRTNRDDDEEQEAVTSESETNDCVPTA